MSFTTNNNNKREPLIHRAFYRHNLDDKPKWILPRPTMCKKCGFKKDMKDMRCITEWRKDGWTGDFEPYTTHFCCRKCMRIIERNTKRQGLLVKKGEEDYRANGEVFFMEEDEDEIYSR